MAGFAGTPLIGLVPARVVGSDRYAGFQVGDHVLPLWAPLPPEVAGLAGREVVLGIRPEDVHDAAEHDDPGFARLTGAVVATELAGPDVWVTLEVDAPAVTAPGTDRADARADRARLRARFPRHPPRGRARRSRCRSSWTGRTCSTRRPGRRSGTSTCRADEPRVERMRRRAASRPSGRAEACRRDLVRSGPGRPAPQVERQRRAVGDGPHRVPAQRPGDRRVGHHRVPPLVQRTPARGPARRTARARCRRSGRPAGARSSHRQSVSSVGPPEGTGRNGPPVRRGAATALVVRHLAGEGPERAADEPGGPVRVSTGAAPLDQARPAQQVVPGRAGRGPGQGQAGHGHRHPRQPGQARAALSSGLQRQVAHHPGGLDAGRTGRRAAPPGRPLPGLRPTAAAPRWRAAGRPPGRRGARRRGSHPTGPP